VPANQAGTVPERGLSHQASTSSSICSASPGTDVLSGQSLAGQSLRTRQGLSPNGDCPIKRLGRLPFAGRARALTFIGTVPGGPVPANQAGTVPERGLSLQRSRL